jgi:hypothetical protein
VIALRQNSLDPRGGAIAWEVGSDGNLDPSHFQQYPGVPRTIDELLAFFGQAPVPTATHPFALATPSASTPVRSSGDAGPDAAVVGAILAALVLLGAIGVAMLRRRTRDA